MRDGSWAASAHEAKIIWRGTDDLDLALLKLSDDTQPRPALTLVFASYNLVGPIAKVDAVGFPQAWLNARGTLRDYTVRGILRIASQLGPYTWSVPPADKPDDPHGWRGMSGAAVCRIGSDDKLYLFGVVQQVPANFSHGQLEVARLSKGFDDAEFCDHLRIALRAFAQIVVASILKPLEKDGDPLRRGRLPVVVEHSPEVGGDRILLCKGQVDHWKDRPLAGKNAAEIERDHRVLDVFAVEVARNRGAELGQSRGEVDGRTLNRGRGRGGRGGRQCAGRGRRRAEQKRSPLQGELPAVGDRRVGLRRRVDVNL